MVKVRTDQNGIARFEVPTDISDKDFEIVLVMQPLEEKPVDAMGYPIGYFEETYGILANEPMERNQPSQADVRDEIQ